MESLVSIKKTVADQHMHNTPYTLETNRSFGIYSMQVNSDIMKDAGICSGDQVLVDRDLQPANGNIVVAKIGNSLCIRKFNMEQQKISLSAPGQKISPLVVGPDFQCWGVVIYVMKKMINGSDVDQV
jgi:SOS-response transcriptional repressor LexA